MKISRQLVIFALLLIFPAFATATALKITPVTDKISPYDTAKFTLTFYNNTQFDKFVISCADLDWSVHTEPLTDYTTGIFVKPGEDYTTTLFVKPLVDTERVFKKHSIEIKARSENGEELSAIINIDVRRDLIKYPLNIKVEWLMPENIFPAKTNSIKVSMQNSNLLNITGLKVSIKSSLFEKTTSVDLGPKGEKVVDFPVTIEMSVPPQKDTATLVITHANSTVYTGTKQYNIAPYGKFTATESKAKKLLQEERTITFTNNGNSEQTEEVLIETGPIIRRLFSSTEPLTKVTQINGIDYYTANLTLVPNQSKTFIVRTDYRPIVYFFIIVIVICVIYFSFRNPIIIAKDVSEVSVEEGGIKKLNVLIKLKNRSGKSVKHVKIIERVPSIAMVQIRESETIKPTRTFPYEDGMVMEYNIGTMEGREIRFISYHLKTKLAVVGGLRLKPVIVQYEGGKKAFSNPVDVYIP